MEGKVGDTDMYISYHCNRLYVTLTLFGAYINRRVLVRRTFSYSFDTWETAIIGRRSRGAQHLQETGLYSTCTRNLEENPPCNAEDNLRAGLIVIEAWFGGY